MPADAHRVEVQPLRSTDPPTLGRHRVRGRLGGGGMGVVYLAEGPLGQVAIKLIRSEYADDPQFRTRFHREVQACFRVGGLHTARLVDFELDADRPWLATEFVDAPDLAAHVAANGPLSFEEQLSLAAGLAEALASIHAVGLIHRDLKPSNVLWTAGGPKVIDFGIAAATEARPLTVVGGVVGTPGWLSPEQAAGGEVTPASDVFGWAAMVAFASTGRPPFGSGRTETMALRDPSVELRVDDSLLAPELAVLVRRALSRDPAQRPTAAQLGERLAGHLWGTPVQATRILPDAARTPTPPGGGTAGSSTGGGTTGGGTAAPKVGSGRPDGPRHRRRLLAVGAAVLVLAAGGTAAAMSLTGDGSASDDAASDGSASDDSASDGSASDDSAGYTATGPWRITIDDQIEQADNGCTATVTNTVTGDRRTLSDIYGRQTYQVPGPGSFRWAVNDPGCLVSAQAGSGTAVLPFAQQASTGDTDAIAPPAGGLSVTVVDFAGSEECGLSLHDVTDGREVAFGTAKPDGGPLLLDAGGRAHVYLADLNCGVTVAPAPQ